jgi:hypothetical protein
VHESGDGDAGIVVKKPKKKEAPRLDIDLEAEEVSKIVVPRPARLDDVGANEHGSSVPLNVARSSFWGSDEEGKTHRPSRQKGSAFGGFVADDTVKKPKVVCMVEPTLVMEPVQSREGNLEVELEMEESSGQKRSDVERESAPSAIGSLVVEIKERWEQPPEVVPEKLVDFVQEQIVETRLEEKPESTPQVQEEQAKVVESVVESVCERAPLDVFFLDARRVDDLQERPPLVESLVCVSSLVLFLFI